MKSKIGEEQTLGVRQKNSKHQTKFAAKDWRRKNLTKE